MSDPERSMALLRRAMAHEEKGQLAEAAADYRSLALAHPQPELFIALASILARLGDRAGQRGALGKALALDPASAAALNNLGLLLEEEGEIDSAADHFTRAFRSAPENGEIGGNLERLLFEKGKRLGEGDPEAALRFHEQAIVRHPGMGGLYAGLGHLRLARCEIGLAEEAFRRALDLRPDDPDAAINYGIALHRLGKPEEALALYDRAASLLGASKPELRWNRSLSLLLLGRLEEGFRDYEARDHYDAYRRLSTPRWDGNPFPGKSLLIHAEQGLGDAIQFVRYAPLVRALGGTVHVACDEPLRRLFSLLPGIDAVVPPAALDQPYDWEVPMLSLPFLFRTTLAAIPAPIPYLALPSSPRGGPLRIALAWSGNPKYRNDLRRSCPLPLFDSLGTLPGTRWINLQPGTVSDETAARPWLADGTVGLADFYETALRLAEVDLVITVDTAMAHLAGALGKKVWILLPAAPDWRWLMERDDSPWYPTARLFRQASEGDWTGVVDRVGAALRAELA